MWDIFHVVIQGPRLLPAHGFTIPWGLRGFCQLLCIWQVDDRRERKPEGWWAGLGGNGKPHVLLAASNSKGGQEMSPVVCPGAKGNWFGDQMALFALGPQHLGDSSKTSLEVGGPVLYLLYSLFENHVYPGQYPRCESLGDPEREAQQSSPTSHQGHHGHDWGPQWESPPSTNWKSDIHPPARTGKFIGHSHLRAHSPAP